MRDLSVNLLASLIAGVAVWLAQRGLRYRRLARQRSFFGIADGATCLLAVSRHAASPHELSVHRRDVAALVDLATIVRECGGRADLLTDEDMPQGIGRVTEFCVGGPNVNARTAAHLRTILRGVRVEPFISVETGLPITVGGQTYRRAAATEEYVVLARVWGPAGGRPVFLLIGQTARTNQAAARYLAANYRRLHRQYGDSGPFCLVLRVVEPLVYGTDFTELVADVTGSALTPDADPVADR
jgi:hypothetical protein